MRVRQAQAWDVHHSKLDRWLASTYLSGPREVRRRARHLAGSIFVGTAAYLGAGAVFVWAQQPGLAALAALNAAGVAALLVPLKRGRSLDHLANAFVGISFPTLAAVTMATGGQLFALLFGASLMPLVALLLTSRRAATLWTAFTCAYLFATACWSIAGLPFPYPLPAYPGESTRFLGALLLVMATFGVTWAYESSRRRSEEEARSSRAYARQLEAQVAEIERRHLTNELERLGTMAGGIVHQFNNILTTLLMTSATIRTATEDRVVRDLTLDIDREAERATQLTGQLLQFSGNSVRRDEPLDFFELVHKTAAGFAGAPIEIVLPETPAPILGDASLLQQALSGLLQNSAEALSGRDGSVTLTGGRRHLTPDALCRFVMGEGRDAGEYVFLEVADEGCGVAAADLPRIFDPFYSTKFPGRGLGLSTLLGILHMHAGAVRIASEPGVGTALELVLPLRPRHDTAAPH
ncbi:MAG: ATP-binding protein [Myxococcota bacterium]